MSIYLIKKAFSILLENRLKTSSLELLCFENKIDITDLILWINKYRKGELEEKPNEEELGKYHYLMMRTDKVVLAKTCQVLYQTLIENDMKNDCLSNLIIKYGIPSPYQARMLANRYANREFESIGIVPTAEEYEKEQSSFSVKKIPVKKREAKMEVIPKINTDLEDNQKTKIKYKSSTGQKAKYIFDYLEAHNFDFTLTLPLEEKYQIGLEQVKVLFNNYLKGLYADIGYLPSEESKLAYETHKKLKEKELKERRKSRKIEIGKAGYEALIASGYDKDTLKPIAAKYNIKIRTVLNMISEYRKRVVEPKPTLEQEKEYLALCEMNHMSNISHMRDNNELVKEIIIEYLLSDEYYLLKIVRKHNIDSAKGFIYRLKNNQDEEMQKLYKLLIETINDRLMKFYNLFVQLKLPITIFDLQMLFKIPLQDIRYMVSQLATNKLIKSDIAYRIGNLIDNETSLMRIDSIEDLDNIIYSHNGIVLDGETKLRIYNHLIGLGVKDINHLLITTYFSKMINGELTLPKIIE